MVAHKKRGRPRRDTTNVLLKRSSNIIVNDLFVELSEENKRLLKELMFANKCLNVLIRFKTFVDFISHSFKAFLSPNQSKQFESLQKEVKNVFSENQMTLKCNRISDNQKLSNEEELAPNDDSLDANHFEDDINVTTEEEEEEYKSNEKIDIKFKRQPKKWPKGKKRFVCDINGYGKQIQSRSSLKTDGKLESKKVYKCAFLGCQFRTTGPTAFIYHTNRHKGIKPYKCHYESCGLGFEIQTKLDYHIKYRHQMADKKLKCPHIGCHYETNQTKRLESHQLIHKGVDPFPYHCHSCSKKFVWSKSLEKHKLKFHLKRGQVIVPCSVVGCFTLLGSDSALERHSQLHRRKGGAIEQHKRFVCGQLKCVFQTNSQTDLESHHRQHWNEMTFCCPVQGCEHRFKRSYELTLHSRAEHPDSRVKMYKCYICEQTFNARTTLYNHKVSAHSEIVLGCEWPGCEYTTKVKSNLATHQRIHSNEKNYLCEWPECHKRFKQKSYLDEHIRIHRNDKRYACSWPGCAYRCTNTGNLQKHIKIHKKNLLNPVLY